MAAKDRMSKELASKRKDIEWTDKSGLGEMNPNYNGGKYIDDKGYVRVLAPEHPASIKGYTYEHRLVMEQYLGRFLHSWESVHHINEIKLDNRLENLFLCSQAEHSAIHREGKRPSEAHREKLRKNMNEKQRTIKKQRQKQNFKKHKNTD